ncbi:hypothetical protein KIPB_012914 [Kipferlia bialata]|uniref:Uncharacterized protein n=1 Tax=Kipferlia bialata TaxID=797122 RepID=A0A9K3DAD1_9EUKA|nr:hypothetical protein KIPB_012914 [Kipferlia bialata]|eukprot:g12914.t1
MSDEKSKSTSDDADIPLLECAPLSGGSVADEGFKPKVILSIGPDRMLALGEDTGLILHMLPAEEAAVHMKRESSSSSSSLVVDTGAEPYGVLALEKGIACPFEDPEGGFDAALVDGKVYVFGTGPQDRHTTTLDTLALHVLDCTTLEWQTRRYDECMDI